MKGVRLRDERRRLDERSSIKIAVSLLPIPVLGSAHSYKYAMTYVVDGKSKLRYDNERGKGDHKHLDDVQTAYSFTTIEQLEQDFLREVESLR